MKRKRVDVPLHGPLQGSENQSVTREWGNADEALALDRDVVVVARPGEISNFDAGIGERISQRLLQSFRVEHSPVL